MKVDKRKTNLGSFVHIQQFEKPLYDLTDYYTNILRPEGFTMLSNGESFLQYGKKAKIINGVSFLFLADIYACPEISKTTNIQHFSGEFAAVTMSRSARQTNLSRDVFGAKNLFYYYKNKLLIAASDIRSIVQVLEKTPAINQAKIAEYLNLNSDSELIGKETFFEDIYRVLPGETCIVFPYGIKKQYFWKPKHYPLDAYSNPLNFFSNAFETALRNRIDEKKRMGANLSGGLDSSSVVSTFRKLSPQKLDTYYFDTKLASAKEKILAHTVSEEKLTQHHDLSQDKDLVLENVLEMIELTASPDTLSVPAVIFLPIYKKAKELGNQVIFSGHGGDNILEMGLDYLSNLETTEELETALYAYFNDQNKSAGDIELEITKFILRKHKGDPKNLIKSIVKGEINLHLLTELIYQKITNKNALKNKESNFANKEASRTQEVELSQLYPNENDPKTKRLLRNNLSKLSIQAMETIQTISAANGMITTYPFLSKEILETVSKIPLQINFHNGKTRGILKKSMENIVPKAVLERKDKSNFTDFFVSFLKDFIPMAVKIIDKNHRVWTIADKNIYSNAEKTIFDTTIDDVDKLSQARICYRVLSLGLWLDTFH